MKKMRMKIVRVIMRMKMRKMWTWETISTKKTITIKTSIFN